jgi:hypothetical protein
MAEGIHAEIVSAYTLISHSMKLLMIIARKEKFDGCCKLLVDDHEDTSLHLPGASHPSHLNVVRADTLNHCGATIYQLCPKSALFKLPALANKDIQTWMRTTFQTEVVVLR